MADIGKVWAGRLYGTNTGNVAATFSSENGAVEGTIRFNDDRFGPVVYQVTGTFDGNQLKIRGKAIQQPKDVQTGDISAEGTLTSEGHLRGTWTSSLGTGGNFNLFPHNADGDAPANPDQPPQVHNESRQVGAIRIHGRELTDLVEVIVQDLSLQFLVVTYRDRTSEKVFYWRDFESIFPKIGQISYLRLFVQQTGPQGTVRSVTVELNATGENEVRTSGPQESWVLGKAAAIESFLRKHEALLVTSYRKHFNLSALLFLVTLIALPSMALAQRVVFIGFVIALGVAFNWIHARVFPNFLASPSERRSGLASRALVAVLSWIGGIIAIVVATVAAYILTEGAPNWLSRMM